MAGSGHFARNSQRFGGAHTLLMPWMQMPSLAGPGADATSADSFLYMCTYREANIRKGSLGVWLAARGIARTRAAFMRQTDRRVRARDVFRRPSLPSLAVSGGHCGGGRRLEHAASSPLYSGSVDPAQGRRADLMARLASAAPREAPAGACFHKSFMLDPAPAGHSHPPAAMLLCAGAKQH